MNEPFKIPTNSLISKMNKEYQNSAFQLIDKLVNKEWNKKRSASRAIGMNSGYHAPMADYILLI